MSAFPKPTESSETEKETASSRKSGPGLWTWLMFLAFVLAATLAFAGSTLIKGGKGFWARQKAERALEKLAEEDYLGAARGLADANRYAREDPVVLRATLKFLELTRSDPRGMVSTLKELLEQGVATPEDLLKLGQTHLRLGEATEARKVYEDLSPEQKQTREGLELLAGVMRAEGHSQDAEDTLREALAMAPEDPDSRLRLAVLDYSNSFPEIHRRARETMWDLAQNQDKTALTAIRFLANDQDLGATEAERLLEVVQAHPEMKAGDRFGVLSALMSRSPQRREEILEAETKRYEGKNVDELLEVLQWLASEKQYTRLLRLVPPKISSKSREVFPLVAQALGEEGRWADLKRLLTSGEQVPVPDARVQVWLAEAASHLNPNDSEQSRTHLMSALDLANQTGDQGSLAAASQVAEKLGMYDVAVRCFRQLAVLSPAMEAGMKERIFEMGKRLRDTDLMIEVTAELVELRPTSGVYRDRLHYLKLLEGEEIEMVAARLDDDDGGVRGEGPTARLPGAFLRALAAFRLRDGEQVTAQLAELGEDFDGLEPGQRAVVAGLKSAVGDVAGAFRLAEQIQPSILLNTELRFLGRAR